MKVRLTKIKGVDSRDQVKYKYEVTQSTFTCTLEARLLCAGIACCLD